MLIYTKLGLFGNRGTTLSPSGVVRCDPKTVMNSELPVKQWMYIPWMHPPPNGALSHIPSLVKYEEV